MLSPALTVLAAEVLVRVKSVGGGGVTVVVVETVLLAVLDSVLVVETDAALVIEVVVVAVGAVVVRVMTALDPAANVPSEAVTVAPLAVQVPPATVQDTK